MTTQKHARVLINGCSLAGYSAAILLALNRKSTLLLPLLFGF